MSTFRDIATALASQLNDHLPDGWAVYFEDNGNVVAFYNREGQRGPFEQVTWGARKHLSTWTSMEFARACQHITRRVWAIHGVVASEAV